MFSFSYDVSDPKLNDPNEIDNKVLNHSVKEPRVIDEVNTDIVDTLIDMTIPSNSSGLVGTGSQISSMTIISYRSGVSVCIPATTGINAGHETQSKSHKVCNITSPIPVVPNVCNIT